MSVLSLGSRVSSRRTVTPNSCSIAWRSVWSATPVSPNNWMAPTCSAFGFTTSPLEQVLLETLEDGVEDRDIRGLGEIEVDRVRKVDAGWHALLSCLDHRKVGCRRFRRWLRLDGRTGSLEVCEILQREE